MKLLLTKQIIRNFKGVKQFEFTPNENITKVFADNGKGKTTLYDAFSWCLYGKNSEGLSDFGMKPVDQFNNEIERLENEVEIFLNLDGKEISLKRIQTEKWTKRRGTKDEVFDGNTTEYFYNGVPVSKGDFEKRIEAEIISEDVFKMITNLNQFNSMHWTKRRDVLFSIVGEVSDQEIEMSNEELNGFVKMLNGSSLDDFKKTIGAKIKKIKEKKKEIPIRIAEVDRTVVAVPEVSEEEIKAKINMHNEVISETELSINDINKRNSEIEGKLKQITLLKNDLISIESTTNQNHQSDYNKNKYRLSDLESNIRNFNFKISNIETENADHLKSIQELTEKRDQLREKYGFEEKKMFVEPDRTKMNCNCCGQSLPSDNIEKTINDMKINHQNNINSELQKIYNEGVKTNEKKTSFEEELKLNEVKIDDIKNSIIEVEKELKHVKKLVEHPVAALTNFDHVESHVNIRKQIAALEKQIKQTEDTSALNGLIKENQQSINDLKEQLAIYETISKSNERKNELLKEEDVYSSELMELEQQEFLCEEFMRSKVDMVEEKINSLFNFVRFKMFEKQVNGAMVETCKALVNTNGSLVDYERANTAGKVNAGIDIVNTLSRFYGISAPIFIDHNESVTKVIDTDSQIIGLYVQEGCNTLDVR